MTQQETHNQMHMALVDLELAFKRVVLAWEQVDDPEALLSQDYPFAQSMDDMVGTVEKWTSTARSNLQRSLTLKRFERQAHRDRLNEDFLAHNDVDANRNCYSDADPGL